MIELTPIEPVDPLSVYDYEVDLGGAIFRIVLRFGDRNERWYLSLFDANGDLLFDGRRMSVDFPIISRFRDERMPDGELSLLDIEDGNRECDFDGLGFRCRFVFVPTDELPPADEGPVLFVSPVVP